MPQQEMLTKESADRILQGEVSSVMAIRLICKANFSLVTIDIGRHIRLEFSSETVKDAVFR